MNKALEQEIFVHFANGMPPSWIAKKLKIPASTVYQVLNIPSRLSTSALKALLRKLLHEDISKNGWITLTGVTAHQALCERFPDLLFSLGAVRRLMRSVREEIKAPVYQLEKIADDLMVEGGQARSELMLTIHKNVKKKDEDLHEAQLALDSLVQKTVAMVNKQVKRQMLAKHTVSKAQPKRLLKAKNCRYVRRRKLRFVQRKPFEETTQP